MAAAESKRARDIIDNGPARMLLSLASTVDAEAMA